MEYSTDCDTRKSMRAEITLLWQFVTPVRRSRIVLSYTFIASKVGNPTSGVRK